MTNRDEIKKLAENADEMVQRLEEEFEDREADKYAVILFIGLGEFSGECDVGIEDINPEDYLQLAKDNYDGNVPDQELEGILKEAVEERKEIGEVREEREI